MSDTVTKTRDKNRRVRQEALREQLSKQGHLQHVVENLKKIEDNEQILDSLMIQRLKIANETRLKLLNKYLPDLKQVEAEINADVGLTVKVIKYGSQDSE